MVRDEPKVEIGEKEVTGCGKQLQKGECRKEVGRAGVPKEKAKVKVSVKPAANAKVKVNMQAKVL